MYPGVRARREHVRRLGAGARGTSSPGRRSESSTDWTSTSASRLACLIAVSAVRTCSGRCSISSSATEACTLISDKLCATTSCRSRAMPSRSSLACRRAVSYLARAKARRLRISSLAASRNSSHAASPTAAQADGAGWSLTSAVSHRKPP
jgi:hypothetical protein